MRKETTILLTILKDDSIKEERELLLGMDPDTWFHSVLTCWRALCIGREMGLSQDELSVLGMGAFLHDVGKAFVNPHILTKPGPLTDKERDQIRRHTVLGRDLLCKNAALSPLVARIAYEHHENEDGSGYPEGKDRYTIHLFSKIVHTADVYDALVSPRPYKKEFSQVDAYFLLSKGAGVQFDLETVKALRTSLLQ